MRVSAEREKVRFASGGNECAAWHYPGTSGACVIMAGGFAVTKEAATDLFAKRFHDAGFDVLAFDYRRLGESGGRPRQVVRIREQLADWRAAIGFAAGLPGVDPARLAIWGFSLAGGHVFRVAARNAELAAAIAQTPNADGQAAARNAARHQKPLALLRLTGRGVLDALGGLAGRRPRLVPLAGEPGTVAVLTTPDSVDGDRALNPDNTCPDWQQAVAARSALPKESSSGCPAGTTSRSWADTSRPSRPSCPSCADTCLILRPRTGTGPPPRIPRCTGANGREGDRAVCRDHRIPGHRRRARARAAARADDGCLAVGRTDR